MFCITQNIDKLSWLSMNWRIIPILGFLPSSFLHSPLDLNQSSKIYIYSPSIVTDNSNEYSFLDKISGSDGLLIQLWYLISLIFTIAYTFVLFFKFYFGHH